jgi:two-component system sensor histidine kinase BaeS
MNKPIIFKLFITFLATSLLIVAGMYIFIRSSLNQGFAEYIDTRQQEGVNILINDLGEYYAMHQNWKELASNKKTWISLLLRANPRDKLRADTPTWISYAQAAPNGFWPPDLTEQETDKTFTPLGLRVMLLDAEKKIIIGRPDLLQQLNLRPILYDDHIVAYLGLLPGKAVSYLSELRFIEKQSDSYLWISLLMIILSACLAMLLAFLLERQLIRITSMAKALAAGRYDNRLTVESNDELGQLARDMNDLAAGLEQSELARRRWVADISHELRTPLAVLRGELEALQDGIRPLTISAIDSLVGDVMRLNRLTEDLYQLSLSDQGALTYRKAHINPAEILQQDLALFQPEFNNKNININWKNDLSGAVFIYGDQHRLSQLFSNLLTNSLNYTDNHGMLEIHINTENNLLLIDISDTEPGVDSTELPKLFDRFYRVESSRNSNRGGAGLGLAICSNIVEAHNGKIQAFNSAMNGLCIHIEFPLSS